MSTNRQGAFGSPNPLVFAAVVACLPFAVDAMAAEAVAQGQAVDEPLGEVVVTGTRLFTNSTFVTPTPTTTLSADQLQISAPESLAAGLRTLPSIVPGGGPTAGGGTANGGQNFLNLRGLGNERTLVLLDGRRFVPSNPSIQIDTNLIPQGLVQRVDVITGGASAAYGSDAVAGVVNFVLNKNFTGLKVNLSQGRSGLGDNAETKAGASFGTHFGNNRGRLIGGVEYFKSDGIDGSQRELRRTAPNMIRNPSGSPTLVRIDDLRTPFTPGGVIITGTGGTSANNLSFQGQQFASNGQLLPYDWGNYATKSTTGSQNGGDGFRVSTGQEVVRPLERKSLFLHGDYELAENIRAFLEFTRGDTESAFQSSPITSTYTIQRGNAYLAQVAPALVSQMSARGVTALTINRITREAGVSLNVNDNKASNLLGGLEGKIGRWKWEASLEYGENKNRNFMDPNLITANFTRALDAVLSPAGVIVCRSTLTNPADGCVPFNPFGQGAPSAAALGYVMGRSDFTTLTRQTAGAANIGGDLFNLPAGPASAVLGVEYRKISANTVSDALSNAGAFRLVNQQNFSGSYEIKEAFAETQLPVLSGVRGIESFDVNLSARHTDYSTSGGVSTWKVGANWQTVPDLRIRATYSRDIRAPNLLDLFATGRQNNITVVDSLTNQTYLSVPNRTFGNVNLKPERAKTQVVGFVYEPAFLPSFRLAVDYWNISISDAISNVGGQNAVTQCNLSNQASAICAFVTRDPVSKAVTATQTAPANFTVQRTHGIDLEASYKTGPFSIRALATNVKENLSLSPLVAVPLDDAGTNTASLPNWRASLSVSYNRGPWAASLQGRYLAGTVWDRSRNNLGVDTDFTRVQPMEYVDGQLAYETKWFSGTQSVFVNVQNLFDKAPPFAPNTGGATPLPTNPNLYDQVGRMFRVGVRVEF